MPTTAMRPSTIKIIACREFKTLIIAQLHSKDFQSRPVPLSRTNGERLVFSMFQLYARSTPKVCDPRISKIPKMNVKTSDTRMLHICCLQLCVLVQCQLPIYMSCAHSQRARLVRKMVGLNHATMPRNATISTYRLMVHNRKNLKHAVLPAKPSEIESHKCD